jgi:thiol-disulfide isomerase/thioredoxin
MALTPSNMMALGTKAPIFNLFDTVSGTTKNLEKLKGDKGTVIAFICNHCPFVIHVNPKLTELAKQYQKKGIGFIAISSNDIVKYPQDAPHLMKQKALEEGYTFPYLFDGNQEVAKAYNAACTPDFYLFDGSLELVYRGQFDDSRPGNGIIVTGSDLKNALDTLIAGKKIDENQKPSIGCSIKWIAKGT